MAKNPPLIEAIMAQRISPWNGAVYTRGGLMATLRAQGKSAAFIDFWVFSPPVLSDEDITQGMAAGTLLNAVPDVFPAWWIEEDTQPNH